MFAVVLILNVCDRDHAGGNEKIKQLVPVIKVYGGSIDNVKGCTNKVENGDKISLGADVHILCLHTPWYTPSYRYRYFVHQYLIFINLPCDNNVLVSALIPFLFLDCVL